MSEALAHASTGGRHTVRRSIVIGIPNRGRNVMSGHGSIRWPGAS